MTHPLTDEMCEKIQLHIFNQTDADCMRSAADWQLEQVIEQWEEVMDSTMTDIQVIREFDKRLKAMRPQEDTP
jgi:hypothetical protein